MATTPIGISFIPSADNQAPSTGGPSALAPNADLAQAYKILSLRLPTTVAPTAPVAPRLLTAPGALTALPSGLSPYAAIFQALLKAGVGGGGTADMPGPSAAGSAPGMPTEGRTVPRVQLPAPHPADPGLPPMGDTGSADPRTYGGGY